MTSPIARLSLEQLRCFNPFDFLTQAYQQQVLDSLQYLTYAPGTPLLQRGQRSLCITCSAVRWRAARAVRAS